MSMGLGTKKQTHTGVGAKRCMDMELQLGGAMSGMQAVVGRRLCGTGRL